MSIEQKLRNWHDSIVSSAPEADPRRTQACLTYADAARMVAASGPTAEQYLHIAGCVWCRRLLDMFRVHARTSVGIEDSAPVAALPIAVQSRISAWLHANSLGSASTISVDHDGNLRVQRAGIREDGEYVVQFRTADVSLDLGVVEVRNGQADFRCSLAGLGVRNISLPEHSIVLHRAKGKGGDV